MTADEHPDEGSEPLTPEQRAADEAFEKRRKETRAWIDLLLDMGYRWSPENSRELVHPEDKELRALHDPFDEQLFISAKLQQQLAEAAGRSKSGQAEGSGR